MTISGGWRGEKYLEMREAELRELRAEWVAKIAELEESERALAGAIAGKRNDLARRGWRGPLDREALTHRSKALQGLVGRLRSRSPSRPWHVAAAMDARVQLLDECVRLETDQANARHYIRRAKEEFFLVDAKLEIKTLFAFLVDRIGWRNRIGESHQKMMALLKSTPIERGEAVLDFARRRWSVQEKRFRKELEHTDRLVEDVENAIRASLCVVDDDPALAAQIDRWRIERFYAGQADKTPFARELVRWMRCLCAKGKPGE